MGMDLKSNFTKDFTEKILIGQIFGFFVAQEHFFGFSVIDFHPMENIQRKQVFKGEPGSMTERGNVFFGILKLFKQELSRCPGKGFIEKGIDNGGMRLLQ